jgi:hypothetical protein
MALVRAERLSLECNETKFGRRPSRVDAGSEDFPNSAAVAQQTVPTADEMVAYRTNLNYEANVRETPV